MAGVSDGAGGAVTLREVARLAGVHPGTASRALNEATRTLVSEATAAKVLAAAAELGYRPNPIARGLKTNRSHTIGVVVPDLLNPLFAAIVRGIEARIDGAGYTPLITNTDNDPERERHAYEAMRSRQVDGIIWGTARLSRDLSAAASRAGERIVLVNRRTHSRPRLPSVTADDAGGARLAVDHLVALGHRRIAHIAGSPELSTGRYRHEGFVAAMRDHGLGPDPDLILAGRSFTVEEGLRLCRELLSRTRDFTAISAGNDLMLLGCHDALAEAGLRCPQDVSLVGFNDMPFSDRFRPPLTTVRIPHYEMGAAAAELMLDILRDSGERARELLLPVELVVRGSSGPPPA